MNSSRLQVALFCVVYFIIAAVAALLLKVEIHEVVAFIAIFNTFIIYASLRQVTAVVAYLLDKESE
jgi:hypothetical protein